MVCLDRAEIELFCRSNLTSDASLPTMVRDWASKVHAKMFQIDDASVRQVYFRYLAYYKIAILVFNLVPYVALRIMG